MKLKNILLVVADIEKSISFYTELFDLQVVLDQDGNVILSEGLVLQDRKIWEKFLGREVTTESNASELYFEEEDLAGFARKLEESSFEITYVNKWMEHSWGQSVIRFYDPDGNLIEVGSPFPITQGREKNKIPKEYTCTSEVQLLRKNEPAPGIFVAESEKVIRRALQRGYKPRSLLVQREQMNQEIEQLVQVVEDEYDAPVIYITAEEAKDIKGFHLTRGVLCAMERKPLVSLEDFLEMLPNGGQRLVILEDIENPTNVGALFRSAAAVGVDGILLTKGCADPFYKRAARVSMGSVFQIPWTYVGGEYVDVLKKKGFSIVAMALQKDSVTLLDERLQKEEKLAIFLGNEGEGLSKETLAHADYTVMIPMAHDVDSLNVGVAGGITFWALCRDKK